MPVSINTTHENVHLKNQVKQNIPRSGKTDQQKINNNNFFYQYSKYVPDFLVRNLRIRDIKDEPYFPLIIISITKGHISYVPLDLVAEYAHILDLNTRLRVGWKNST